MVQIPQFNLVDYGHAVNAGQQIQLNNQRMAANNLEIQNAQREAALHEQLDPIAVQNAKLEQGINNMKVIQATAPLIQPDGSNYQQVKSYWENQGVVNPGVLPAKYDPEALDRFTGAVSHHLDLATKKLGLKTQQTSLDIMKQREKLFTNYFGGSIPGQFNPNQPAGQSVAAQPGQQTTTPPLLARPDQPSLPTQQPTNPQPSALDSQLQNFYKSKNVDISNIPSNVLYDPQIAAYYQHSELGNAVGIKNPSGDAYIKQKLAEGYRPDGTVDPSVIKNATNIANYDSPALTGRAAASPQARLTSALIKYINPNYDAKNYQVIQGSMKEFSPAGQAGRSVRRLNTSIQHLDLLNELIDNMNNRGSPIWNSIANQYEKLTGNPAPTNLAAARKIVGDEVTGYINSGAGGVSDRADLQHSFDTSGSPEQIKGVANTLLALMHGQTNSYRFQYQNSTMKNDFDKRFLQPRTQQVLNRFDHSAQPVKPGPQTTAPQGVDQAVWNVMTPQEQALWK